MTPKANMSIQGQSGMRTWEMHGGVRVYLEGRQAFMRLRNAGGVQYSLMFLMNLSED